MIVPYYIPIKGGITSYVSSLVTNLNKNDKYNFNTTVIARYGKTDENTYIINQKIYFIIKSFLILCKKRPDVIHAHSHWYILTPSVIYKLIHPKTRLIFTFHTELIDELKGLKKIALLWLLSRCNTITFVSKALMKKVEDNFEITTTKKVIYAGVSVKKVSEAELQQFKERFLLKNNAPILAFVGPLVWKQKVEGVKLLIKSFRIISEKYPNSKLLIIGDGKYKRELQQLTEKSNIRDNVVFTGFVDNVFVPLSITDIYTHISLQEGGVSISLLEAMSRGKPVIATKVGGIPELINDGENGILIDAEPRLIAKAIIRLYGDNKKMKELGENAYTTVKKKHTWDKIADEFRDLYMLL